MLARTVRSGLVESRFDGEVVAVDTAGSVVARWGAIGRPFFMRSAAKPFQATISLESGADLAVEELALACASHGGEPVHVAIVAELLGRLGLTQDALVCPPDLPLTPAARDRVCAAGDPRPRRIYHNCSGKHAAMLAACQAAGWPSAGYADPGHPIQQANAALLAEVTGADPTPVGVDGCGVPTFRTTVAGMARAFARLANEARFGAAVTAMHRFPALTSGSGRLDAHVATMVGGVAKIGAEGCVGVAVAGQLGLAVKVDSGAAEPAVLAAAAALRALGLRPAAGAPGLAALAGRPVLGRGEPVGVLEAALTAGGA